MTTKHITIYALMIALTVALSLTVLIPVPATNGFVTLCEAGIYTTASLFGPLGGLTVGATSGLLIDLISGYPQWAIFSFLIHGLQGVISGYFAKKSTTTIPSDVTSSNCVLLIIFILFTSSILCQNSFFLQGICL